jgi:hypothetical protein
LVAAAAHLDLSAQLAYFDEEHPLRVCRTQLLLTASSLVLLHQVKQKPSRFAKEVASKERPKTAPVRRRIVSAMPHEPAKAKINWSVEVRLNYYVSLQVASHCVLAQFAAIVATLCCVNCVRVALVVTPGWFQIGAAAG